MDATEKSYVIMTDYRSNVSVSFLPVSTCLEEALSNTTHTEYTTGMMTSPEEGLMFLPTLESKAIVFSSSFTE